MLSNERLRRVTSLLQSRMKRFILTLPSSMERDVHQYLRSPHRVQARKRSSRSVHQNQPYWILLPLWLEQTFRFRAKGSTSLDRRFIHDVLWAQYCLFQQVAIHDELFDRHQSNLGLIFAANQFQLEADRVMSKHFGRASEFWKVYRTSLSETYRAIIEVRSLQRSKTLEPGDFLAWYNKSYAVVKVGSAAVCARMHRMRHFPHVSRFAGEMAKIGQALDDLTDIEEDLERGEFNYASAYILQSRRKKMPDKKHALKAISHALLAGDAIPQFFRELRVHLHRARRAIQPLKIDAATEYLQRYEASLTAMEEHIHRQRVRLIFGNLARSSK